MISPDEALAMAAQAIGDDQLPWAEALCRGLLEKNPNEERALALMKELTACVGPPRPNDAPAKDRFLLIKSWGKGFWSDVDHVLGSLLAAEMTHRTPVIHWGSNNLFTAPGIENVWNEFFEPISALGLADLARQGLSFFPPKWSAGNLKQENLNVWQGPGSRVTGLSLLNHAENVVVCDFHVAVPGLIPWLDQLDPHHGRSPREVYRYLFDKYLRPQRTIVEQVEAFHAFHLAGRPYIAVHFRGADKYVEQRGLAEINASCFEHVDRLAEPSWRIFLLTDDATAANSFRQRYGDRLVLADAERSADQVGVHSKPGGGPRRGAEVMIDTYLAARADRFVGNGASNVSAAVVHLKDWADPNVALLAPIRQYRTVPTLFRPR